VFGIADLMEVIHIELSDEGLVFAVAEVGWEEKFFKEIDVFDDK
jgi:hypothetical protein